MTQVIHVNQKEKWEIFEGTVLNRAIGYPISFEKLNSILWTKVIKMKQFPMAREFHVLFFLRYIQKQTNRQCNENIQING